MGNRVLVADDHPPTVELIKDALVREGFTVATASNGRECLRMIAAEQPELVILDVVMPEVDGFKVLRTLREQPETEHLPVILLTGRAEHGDVLTGWMAGADVYLNKPCTIEELLGWVKRTLGATTAAR
jgi:DNA-binding response OmpR family regulator